MRHIFADLRMGKSVDISGFLYRALSKSHLIIKDSDTVLSGLDSNNDSRITITCFVFFFLQLGCFCKYFESSNIYNRSDNTIVLYINDCHCYMFLFIKYLKFSDRLAKTLLPSSTTELWHLFRRVYPSVD